METVEQVTAPLLRCNSLEDGYLGFRARVKSKVDQMKEIVWHDQGPILLKPTTSAPQSKYMRLAESDEELVLQLKTVWQLAAKRKAGQGSFKPDMFIYVQKVGATTTIRRATESRIATAAALIDEHVSQRPLDEAVGPASQAYWAISHARQPENPPIVTPSTQRSHSYDPSIIFSNNTMQMSVNKR